MTIAFSAVLQVHILTWVKGTDFPTAPSSIKFGLMTQQPDHDGGNLYELNDNGYARQTIEWGSVTTDNATATSTITSTNAVIFGPATVAPWPQANYGGYFDGDTGDILAYGPLAAARTAAVGDTISFGAGAFQLRSR